MPTDPSAREPSHRANGTVTLVGLALVATLIGLEGCALQGVGRTVEPVSPSAPGERSAAQGGAVPAGAAPLAAAASAVVPASPEPRYLRFRAEDTGLVSVHDDGRLSYLEFADAVAADLQCFDQDGRPMSQAIAGRVVAIAGLHPGVLVRRGERASFVAPNPRSHGLPRPGLPAHPDFAEARARLDDTAGLMQAMQRALEASRARSAGAATPADAVRTAPPVALQVPLAAANLSTQASEQGLVRVYFASASRAIVAPDDGLALLMREAHRADEIRVTGFTDATGSPALNEALARARADAVVQILIRRGIPRDRIQGTGVAGTGFVADNASERGRALNRRAEIVLLRNGVPLLLGSDGGR